MSFNIAGAIVGAIHIMAGASGNSVIDANILSATTINETTGTSVVEPFEFQRFAPVEKKKGVAKKVLSAVAGAAAAATVYRLSDAEHAIAYYPLEARIGNDGVNFTERLAVNRGGMKFQLSAIKQSAGPNANAGIAGPAPDFRRDARKMSSIMPGYPQPPKIVIGLKVSY